MTMIELDVEITPTVAVDIETPAVTVSSTPGETVTIVAAPVPGPPGPPGPPGEPGTPFEGTAWFYGEGPPGTIVGSKVGDYYVDTATGTIYRLGD
jgi:hypothetical protein